MAEETNTIDGIHPFSAKSRIEMPTEEVAVTDRVAQRRATVYQARRMVRPHHKQG